MRMLQKTSPYVYHESENYGSLVVSWTKNSFPAMGHDQRHDQHKKDFKDDWGILGLSRDSAKLLRWM